jgi:hypothetical protein
LKTVRKIFFYTLLVLGVLLVSFVLSVYLFREKILNQFIREANKSLNTPVKVGKMEVSVFEEFPQISIVLHQVYVEDSHPGEYPLLTAGTISFQLDPVAVWAGQYTIKGLQVSDSETNLKINDKGQTNYNILKKTESNQPATSGSLSFQLKDVGLKNTRVRYYDIRNTQDLSFTSKTLLASIESTKDVYTIAADGELTSTLNIDGSTYLAGKSFTIDANLVYDDIRKNLAIRPSNLELNASAFKVKGEYSWKEKNYIDLSMDGSNTDIQTLLSLLPESQSKPFRKYQSKGDTYFSSNLKGEIGKRKNPSLSVTFGFKDATIFHPDYKSRIEDATLEGSFASTNVSDMSKAVLVLKNIHAKLNGEPFSANLIIHDLQNPEVQGDFKGRLDAAGVLGFYPIESIKDISGALVADLSFDGKLELLKKKATAQRFSTRGTVDLQQINLVYGPDKTALKNLNGNLQFNNNDLALSNVSCQLGSSDFILNGFFKNIITFLLFENQPIGIEADLKSNFLNVDQLFAIGFGKPTAGQGQKYEFSIPVSINLNFNCDVKALRYKRFHARQLKGDVLVKNQMAVSRSITFRSMGGDMACSGIVDAKNKKAIEVVSSFKLNGIHADSVFYVFENFDQSFIEDRHLKGQATADVNLEMTLNENLNLYQETLVGDISAVIRNGELNNFEPLKKLNKFIDDASLHKLRFADIKNDIHIENKTVYIPQMEIRSNVTSLKISGTHTFDQHIDYHIVTPLRKRQVSDTEELNAIEDEGSGRTNLLLKITGTTDNYKVSYDTKAVKKKIAADLKNEVKELKDAFKNKGTKQKKEVELEKDDYFDWDNPQE